MRCYRCDEVREDLTKVGKTLAGTWIYYCKRCLFDLEKWRRERDETKSM